MADFLLVAGSRSKRLFCASWSTLYAYQISFAYDKVGGGAAILSPAHFHLATPTSENFRFRKFSPSRTCVQKFVSFHGRLGPQKCIRFGRKKERKKERKNNPYNFNRSLGTVGARALIKTASGGERALAPACGPPPVAVGFLLRSTSCRSQEVGPRDFPVRLCRLYMCTFLCVFVDSIGGSKVLY